MEIINKSFINDVVKEERGSRKNVYQIVGFPISFDLLKEYAKLSNYPIPDQDEDDMVEFEHNAPIDMFNYLVRKRLITAKFNIYKMPCCYYDIAPHKYIFGMIIHKQSPWVDYELFDLFSLSTVNEDTVWGKFMNITESNIRFAKDIYESNPNIPPPKDQWGRYTKIGAFALEYIKKVIIKEKMTAEEFMEYKKVKKDQLYDMYFDRITSETVKYITSMYNIFPLKDENVEITSIVKSDDCYTCT